MYKDNGTEFEYFEWAEYGELEREQVISALSISIYKNKNFIKTLAVDKECKTCKKYNITCFPKVVVYK